MISDTATPQTPDMSAATSNAKAIEGASTNSTTVNGAGTFFRSQEILLCLVTTA